MEHSYALFLLVAALIQLASSNEFRLIVNSKLTRNADAGTFDALTFLESAGFLDDLDDTTDRHHAPDSVRQAFREFQKFYGLPVTGRIDAQTINMMKRPRCGNPDVIKPRYRQRNRTDDNAPEEYQVTAYDWSKNDLTYKWTRISERMLSKDVIRRATHEAFENWSRVTPLNFRETSGDADIELLFVSKDDPEPCAKQSSSSGMLAHAFFRKMHDERSGQIHFDDAEAWGETHQAYPNYRMSLRAIATHEIGHVLGLGHSNLPQAIMFANYNAVEDLTDDDIQGIQKLYGRRDDQSDPIEHNCHMTFDDVAHGEQGDVFAFAGEYFYLITQNGLSRKKKIKEWFKGAPDSPDAVVYDKWGGWTYFFKDKYCYRFDGYHMSEGFPAELPNDFHNVDAAVQRFDQNLYLFKGDLVTKWEIYDEYGYPYGFPQTIKSFYNDSNAPARVTAAFDYNNGTTFLFNGDKYWKYVAHNEHEQRSPGYPKSIQHFWLHCGFVPGRDEEPLFGYVG